MPRNALILYDNRLASATLAADGTVPADMGVELLRDDQPTNVFRTLGNAASVTLTWPSAQTVRAVLLGSTNLTAAATLRVRASSRQTTNFLLRSAALGTAPWGATRCAASADAAAAPDGSTTAERLVADGTGAFVNVAQAVTVSGGAQYVLSAHLKAGTASQAALRFRVGAATFRGRLFDLASGTALGTTDGAAPDASGIAAVGGGWWRCWIRVTIDPAYTTGTALLYVAAGGSIGVTPAAGSYLDAWGVQLEAGAAPGAYVATAAAAATDWAVDLYDSGAVPAETGPRTNGNVRHILPADVPALHVRIDVADPSLTHLDIGLLLVGPVFIPTRNFSYGWGIGRAMRDQHTETRWGPTHTMRGGRGRVLELSFDAATEAEAMGEVFDLWRLCGEAENVALVPLEGVGEQEAFVIGQLRDGGSVAQPSHNLFAWRLRLVERL